MVEVVRHMPVPPERVFAVLADGWTYPLWVVGATHMREVDEHWPRPGARLHHSVGAWPLMLSDVTEVIAVVPERRLELEAYARPLGGARIVIELRARDGGTEVSMNEWLGRGVGRLVPGVVQQLMLRPRNIESLQRLEAIAVSGAAGLAR
jgi:uncharacterized protein YndB with AHSA1/START domain